MTTRAAIHPYTMVDPRLLTDPRVYTLTPLDAILYLRLVGHCAEYGLDGVFVDEAEVMALTRAFGVDFGNTEALDHWLLKIERAGLGSGSANPKTVLVLTEYRRLCGLERDITPTLPAPNSDPSRPEVAGY